MGAHSTGSFDNDDAMDWVGNVLDEPGMAIVLQALTTVAEFSNDDYVELPECCAGAAAAEVVAALNKKTNPEMPEDLAEWGASSRGVWIHGPF